MPYRVCSTLSPREGMYDADTLPLPCVARSLSRIDALRAANLLSAHTPKAAGRLDLRRNRAKIPLGGSAALLASFLPRGVARGELRGEPPSNGSPARPSRAVRMRRPTGSRRHPPDTRTARLSLRETRREVNPNRSDVTLEAAPRSLPLPGFWAQPYLLSPCAGRSFLRLSTGTVRTQAADRPTQGESRTARSREGTGDRAAPCSNCLTNDPGVGQRRETQTQRTPAPCPFLPPMQIRPDIRSVRAGVRNAPG
jgi:hypothetical protein